MKKVKSPLIVPYFVPYQHSLTMNLILRAILKKEGELVGDFVSIFWIHQN